jgi:hypothetical protein
MDHSGEGRAVLPEEERGIGGGYRFLVESDDPHRDQPDDDWYVSDVRGLLEVLKRNAGCTDETLLAEYDEAVWRLTELLDDLRTPDRDRRVKVRFFVDGYRVSEFDKGGFATPDDARDWADATADELFEKSTGIALADVRAKEVTPTH